MTTETEQEKKWQGTTFGNGFMHRVLIALLRTVDIRFIYFFAYVFVLPPCLFRPGFRHAYHFFRDRLGCSGIRSVWYACKNHCMFVQVVIDKFAMYAGKHFDLELEGYDHFLRLADGEAGFVQLSSHVGNYEIAGYSLVAEKKRFNALVFSGEKEEIMHNRERLFSSSNIHMIPVRQDMSHLFEINSALSNGETVSIPADRIWGSNKYVTKTFLGKEAHFPVGPFRVIALLGVEALVVHVMKTSYNCYKTFVTPIPYDKEAPRASQIAQLSDGYVKEMERILKMYPTQWYNYFDFWMQ